MRTETRDVRGIKITVTQLEALDLIREWPTVVKRLGSLLALLPKINPKKPGDLASQLTESEMLNAFTSLGDNADEVFMMLLATAAAHVGKGENKHLVELDNRAAINEVFSGDMLALFQAGFFALEVHYGDFLGGDGAPDPEADQAEKTGDASN